MGKINCDIVAITHRLWIDNMRKTGGFDVIIDYLSCKGRAILLIEHPLTGLKEDKKVDFSEIVISLVENQNFKEIKRIKINNKFKILRWIKEPFFNLKYIKNNIAGKPVLMAADPLNGIISFFFKNRFSKVYLHCIDYSDKRFDNFILNIIYKLTLFLSVESANYIGVVSLRIKNKLVGLFKCAQKIIYIPNSPIFRDISTSGKVDNLIVYSVNKILKKYNYDFVVDLIYELKKDIGDIRLYALGKLGEDEYSEELKRKIKNLDLEKNIIFPGYLNKEELEKILLKAKVGFSFYDTNSAYYTYFGDSLKIREYALYGIPSICDGNSATDGEAVNEGCAFIANNTDEAIDKIKRLLLDEKFYNTVQQECISWAKKMDKFIILNRLYDILFLSGK